MNLAPHAPDWPFLVMADRVVGVLQSRCGLSLAILRRESVAAIWVSLALVCAVEVATHGLHSRAPFLLGVGAATFFPLLRHFRSASRDARAVWSPAMARRYEAESEAARRDGWRFAWRMCAGIQQCVLVGVAATRGLEATALAMVTLNLAVLAHQCIACSTPRTPGRKRRRSASIAAA